MNKLLAITTIILISGYLNGCDKQREAQQPIEQQQAYQPQTGGQPVIINQQPTQDNGIMAGALGFMAGRMLSSGGSSSTNTHTIEKHYIAPTKKFAPVYTKPTIAPMSTRLPVKPTIKISPTRSLRR